MLKARVCIPHLALDALASLASAVVGSGGETAVVL